MCVQYPKCEYRNLLFRSIGVAFLIVATTFALSSGADARERDWYRYENDYFVAYSDAREKQVLRLLEDLENFRAAVGQILALRATAQAEKTRVIAFHSRRPFEELVNSNRIGAFAATVDEFPFIVMPIRWRSSSLSGHVVRHEYTHVLLQSSGYSFPSWFREGFAEFMAGTRFKDRETKYTLGDVAEHLRVGERLTPWTRLLSDDFDAHEALTSDDAPNAYYQAWILVHYLILGNELGNYPKLRRYLGRVAAGEPSISALGSEFGLGPEALGELAMQDYRRGVPVYEFEFEAGTRDQDFSRTAIGRDKISEMIAHVQGLLPTRRGHSQEVSQPAAAQ